jgi:hypothetical protein
MKAFCNCCGKQVEILTDEVSGDSICRECRSYDITRECSESDSVTLDLLEETNDNKGGSNRTGSRSR